jgi:hypothetical protein
MPCKRSGDALQLALLILKVEILDLEASISGVQTLAECLEFWYSELEIFETRLVSKSSLSWFSKANGVGRSGFWRSSGAIGDKSDDRVSTWPFR